MTDLQCPARIFLVRPWPPGGDRAPAVAESLRDQRVSAVHAAPGGSVAAETLAAALDVPVAAGADLDDLADRYRGEAIAVVADHSHGSGAVVLLESDADGRRVSRWDVPALG